MEDIQLIQLNNDERTLALKKLGYGVDSKGYVINLKKKEEVICKYSKEKVHINKAAILPSSLLVINATLVTMTEYFLDTHNKDE